MQKKEGIITNIMRKPKAFSVSFVLIFLATFVFLYAVGATPEPQNANANASTPEASASLPAVVLETQPEMPVRVEVKRVGVNATVSNPASAEVHVLDSALTKGAVRHPSSVMLGEAGTVLLFGHSSYLPVVHNKAYKAFNEIGKLESGDIVSVYSSTLEYRYKVVGVRLADAREDVVELPSTGKHLTLVTCDTFSKKSSRFIVEADFVGTYSLVSN